MNREHPNSSGDDLIRQITDSFEHQPIPPRPSDVETVAMTNETAPVTAPTSTVAANSLARMMPTVSIIVACIVIGIAFWHVDLAPQTSVREETPRHPREQRNTPVPSMGQSPFKEPSERASTFQSRDDPSSVVTESADSSAVGKTVRDEILMEQRSLLLDHVESTNDWIAGRVDQPETLLVTLGQFLGTEQQLRSAFASMGRPAGILSVRQGTNPQQSWLQGEHLTAFTYQVDYRDLLLDLQRLVDAYLEDEVFEDVLDGLQHDPNGPQVDLRQIVLSQFADSFVVAIDSSDESSLGRMMIVFPLKDADRVRNAIGKLVRKEPGADRSQHVDRQLTVIATRFGPRALCVSRDCLMVGSLQVIREAIARSVK